jgi:5,10-methylenetetrahydromethanopterin reductase
MDSAWARDLGVGLMGRRAPAHAAQWSRSAERAGLGSVWFVEDYFQPGACAIAGAGAAATEGIAIGVGVLNPFTRHPAVLAMETATLTGLAPGRVVLGLGTSNRRWIEEQMGLPFKTPHAILADCVDVLRRLLAGDTVSHENAAFTLRDVRLECDVAQVPPILLGVKGPKALDLAGRIADGVHGSILSSPPHIRRVRTITEAARRRAGRSGPFPVLAYVPISIAADAATARARTRPFLAKYLALLHGQTIIADAGISTDTTAQLREALAAGRDAAALITDDIVDALTISGAAEDCRASLRRWSDAGLDAPIAVPMPGSSIEEQLTLYGSELAPAWRRWR